MSAALVGVYSASARYLRKVQHGQRFNRKRAARPLRNQVTDFWDAGVNALFSYMAKHDGWEKLQRHVQLALAADSFRKVVMSDGDRKFLADLLASFGYFADSGIATKAREIIEATSIPTFEEAAKFALRQLGVASPDFELRNDKIREALLARQEAAVFSTRTFMDETFQTITAHFYELGKHPYNQASIDELRSTLGYKSDWQARRFSLTETGIASELAQVETYRRNGVGAKQWNCLDVNSRQDHLALAGVIAPIAGKFNCGGYAADHPLDPKLPASEVCNCHCWLSPVVDDNFEVDPSHLWEGK